MTYNWIFRSPSVARFGWRSVQSRWYGRHQPPAQSHILRTNTTRTPTELYVWAHCDLPLSQMRVDYALNTFSARVFRYKYNISLMSPACPIPPLFSNHSFAPSSSLTPFRLSLSRLSICVKALINLPCHSYRRECYLFLISRLFMSGHTHPLWLLLYLKH